ncbi:viperin family antiviral radical SAM protein [Kingella kingae]|uniref:viperin family antiviral radical SAM protein n=1 Tax=Kingella kingae TaxID=504 RepID=UPI002551AA61|nr:viperin family antiviral radical SAM protein [Kingella kingae]MDK4573735.1 viperin family antiviral radical SAM protein [Kingella kingae]MDK4605853.1 viperin family antiviral radical SAM protein [Kingella kingae]
MKELVINWHITEACNFKCRYCFAKWEQKDTRELFHSHVQTKKLLDELQQMPTIINQQQNTQFQNIRLNLVGGEIFLYPDLMTMIIHEAKLRGFGLSAITNGSLISDDMIDLVAKNFSMIGFSVDSLNDETNRQIGRMSKDEVLQIDKVKQCIHTIKKINPNIYLKINTVVNSLNYQEDLSEFLLDCQLNKWKVFKMLPIVTHDLSINDEQFQHFINNHRHFSAILNAEDNDEMTASYLMIDPLGRFFSNESQSGYIYSEPITQIGVETAFNHIQFETQKFKNRYKIHVL